MPARARLSKPIVGGYLRTEGGASSYGEQIVLEARDGTARHMPGAVLPLILSGLPSFLWWNGEPPWRTEQFEAMVDGCDRIIVDTSEMTHGEDGLVALDDIDRRKLSNCAFSDFNWTRQQPWRELVAGFFDADVLRAYLDGIDRLTVEYAAGDENSLPNPAPPDRTPTWPPPVPRRHRTARTWRPGDPGRPPNTPVHPEPSAAPPPRPGSPHGIAGAGRSPP